MQQKTVQVTLRLTPEDYQKMKIISILENTTVPRTIEKMIQRRLSILHQENLPLFQKVSCNQQER